ncbi:hypothetical protein [Undibacterium sp.]|uniref:hypothetical protein n=1 Tax=Undibacterium sp. TaxID=1914977 RepID=UPI003753BA40
MADPFYEPEPEPGIIDWIKKVISKETKGTEDVRCLGLDITSTAGIDERYVAAVRVYRQIGNVYSFGRDPEGRKTIKVIFADGGTETWIITQPTMSDGGAKADFGTLRLGTGEAIPKTDC